LRRCSGGRTYTSPIAEELRIVARPALREPVLISAFRGWNDGGQGASLAGGYLAKTWEAERFAEIEPEGFFDFQATRPHVSLVDGRTRRIDWPENAFYHAPIPGLDRDAILLLGIEPNLRWRTFSTMIVDLARELGVEMMITLGSLLADVPHTRPSPVTGGATDPELTEQLGLQRSRYEGPTGIVGVLHDACNTAHIASVSLWAAVPHYVSLAPSPRAALALCQRLGDILGTEIDTGELDEASERYSEQVSEAVASDEETAAYVQELEERAEILDDDQEIPSGESLAAELTRFLRDRDREHDNGDSEPGPSEQP
jgi:proteasome assembly chaperone (PAC2) family protein